MNTQIKIILASLLLSISSLAIAEDTFKIENPYVQLKGGLAFFDDNTSNKEGVNAVPAIHFSVGFDLSKQLGLEAGVGAATVGYAAMDTVYLSLVAKHAVSENTILAGKVGITDVAFRIGSEFHNVGVSGMAGVDLIYNFNKNIASVVSIEHFGLIKTTPVTIGVRYTF